jgi:cytochrome c oxidase assembly factor CtaG
MWLWHVPALYDAAAAHTGIHVLEHLCFTLAGFLYWWHLISPVATRLRREGTTPIVYMLSTKVTVGFLGILLTFAPTAVFAYYEHQPRYWGLEPHSDQALAGAVMALEQAIVMGIALAVLFVRMLAQSEREQQRRERYEPA